MIGIFRRNERPSRGRAFRWNGYGRVADDPPSGTSTPGTDVGRGPQRTDRVSTNTSSAINSDPSSDSTPAIVRATVPIGWMSP